MALVNLTFQYSPFQLNTSVQIGDLAWAVLTPSINSSTFTGNDIDNIELVDIDETNIDEVILSQTRKE